MGNIIEIMEIANRVLGKLDMEASHIKNEKLFIEDYCIFTEGEILLHKHQLRRIESAIINSRMGRLSEALDSERHYEMYQLSLED